VRDVRSIFTEWYPRLVRFLRARLADPDRAEDLAQEAFVRLLNERPRKPGAWLLTVAARLAIDDARAARGRARHLTLLGAESASDADPGPEPSLLRGDEIARVRRALGALAERDRMLLLLHADGARYREIAAHVGVAPSSVGTLLARAQRRLLRQLAHGADAGEARSVTPLRSR
jgi:RNA polymerase sigma-70 factor (ECF subfamily)